MKHQHPEIITALIKEARSKIQQAKRDRTEAETRIAMYEQQIAKLRVLRRQVRKALAQAEELV